ncbi:MAG: hypothetical protein KAI24_14735 [Planctomycetes bacterium]|nr:hypothetical protein [Planctomycetota bacterium]
MNNTKWREVWLALAEMRLRIHFAFFRDADWNEANATKLRGPFSSSQVEERGIGDPGIGGPFLYKEILWVRVPRVPGNDVDGFLERVRSLGQLPMNVVPDYVEIRGCRES